MNRISAEWRVRNAESKRYRAVNQLFTPRFPGPRPTSIGTGAGELPRPASDLYLIRGGRSPNSQGFTLIEVLLALAILAVILTAVYASFSTASRNVESAEAVRDETDLARTLIARLSDDIANAYYNATMSGTTIFYGKKEEVGTGNDKSRFDSLAMTTLTNWRKPDSKETDLWEVGYHFEETADGNGRALMRREKRELSQDIPLLEGGVDYEITDRVEGFQLRYNNGSQWSDEWDTRKSPNHGLPKAVEITLTLVEEKRYVTVVDVGNKR